MTLNPNFKAGVKKFFSRTFTLLFIVQSFLIAYLLLVDVQINEDDATICIDNPLVENSKCYYYFIYKKG